MQQKKVGWEVIFSELGFAGSRAHKPRWEFKGSTLKPFFHVFLRPSRAFIVYKLPHKSQCNFITLLGKYLKQKKVGWEVIFSELGFTGSGARKP